MDGAMRENNFFTIQFNTLFYLFYISYNIFQTIFAVYVLYHITINDLNHLTKKVAAKPPKKNFLPIMF